MYKRQTYAFGASNTMTGDLYVRKNNSDVIYTVSGTKATCFELTRAELDVYKRQLLYHIGGNGALQPAK